LSKRWRIGATLTPEAELRFEGFRVDFEIIFRMVDGIP
jgi:hypothetical protein